MAGELTFRQRLFVEAFLGESNGNATEAARIAGYPDPNKQGPRMLVFGGIQAAIDARLNEAALTTNEILARLSEQATADVDDFITVDKNNNNDYKISLSKARAAGKTHLIKKLTPTKYGVAIELHDPQAALVQLGRYRGLFVDRTKHEHGDKSDEEILALAKGLIAGAGPPGVEP